jgi:hypothetical protein
MSLQLDPARLARQPLLLHQREPGEYWAMVAGFIAGRVSRYESPEGIPLWLWTLTGPTGSGKSEPDCGDGGSLLDAKKALHSSLQHHIDEATRAKATIGWTE